MQRPRGGGSITGSPEPEEAQHGHTEGARVQVSPQDQAHNLTATTRSLRMRVMCSHLHFVNFT